MKSLYFVKLFFLTTLILTPMYHLSGMNRLGLIMPRTSSLIKTAQAHTYSLASQQPTIQQKKYTVPAALLAGLIFTTGTVYNLQSASDKSKKNTSHEYNAKACKFCSILTNDKEHQIIREGKHVVAIERNVFKPCVHFLIVPKEHIVNLQDPNLSETKRQEILSETVELANTLAKEAVKNGFSQHGHYSIHSNSGIFAVPHQSEFHLHFHILARDEHWFKPQSRYAQPPKNYNPMNHRICKDYHSIFHDNERYNLQKPTVHHKIDPTIIKGIAKNVGQ